eukprot:GGOE01049396.1.p1 GENE.GGOE01049396.1~~GGOE01049396.1.p1  ORF type:complete len:454 (-),score=104.43 GGOE01049396.1:182-1474(-)
MDGDEFYLRKMCFHSPTVLNGKYAFVMPVDLRHAVGTVKRKLHAREGLTSPLPQLAFFLEGEELEDERSFGSYPGIRAILKSSIAVRGAQHELLVKTAVVEQTVPVRWTPHLTMTEMLRAVWRRWQVDLEATRFSLGGRPLPIKNCFRPRRAELPWTLPLQELGFGRRGQPMCDVWFRRSQHGALLNIQLQLPAVATVQDVHVAMTEWELQFKMAHATPASGGGWVEDVLGPVPAGITTVPLSDDHFDDEHPGVAGLSGQRALYVFFPGLPEYVANGLPPDTCYFSYHPPFATEPEWVDIEMDYTVPHLLDLGAFPGSVVTVEFFSPSQQLWSGDCPLPPMDDYIISVRSLRGRTLHIGVDMDEPVQNILTRIWCATGDDPHLLQLETEEGRILPEWQSLSQLCMVPETRFVCARQSANNSTYAPRIPDQ